MASSTDNYLQELTRKLDSAAEAVMPRAIAGDFENAERAVFAVENDIYGRLAAARMYLAAINRLGGVRAKKEDRTRVRSLFDRAVQLREEAYPTPHTAEEAESYDEGSKRQRGLIIQELGFDPHA